MKNDYTIILLFISFKQATSVSHLEFFSQFWAYFSAIKPSPRPNLTPAFRSAHSKLLEERDLQEPVMDWGNSRQCVDGSISNIEAGRSVSLTGDGNLMLQGSLIGVTLFDYNDESGWREVFDFSPLLDSNGFRNYVGVIADFGERVAIGSPGNTEKGFDSGSVQVFEKGDNITSWTQIGRTLTGDQRGDLFGFSLDLTQTGDKLIVGAFGNGVVEIFEYQDHINIWTMSDFLEGEATDGFGYSVAIDGMGTKAIIGAPFANSDAGFARVKDITRFTFVSQIDGAFPGEEYGKSVDISDDGFIVAVGAPGSDTVEIERFNIDSNSWSRVGSRIQIETESFGSSVSISGDGSTVAIGAPLNDFYGPIAGNGYLFEYGSDDTWVEIGKDFFGKEVFAECGADIALSSNTNRVAVSCPGTSTDLGGIESGQICVYTGSPTTTISIPPSTEPSITPMFIASTAPSRFPTISPSELPKPSFTSVPTAALYPSLIPTLVSSSIPTIVSLPPSSGPTVFISSNPSISVAPSAFPTASPSGFPSNLPTTSSIPSLSPSAPRGRLTSWSFPSFAAIASTLSSIGEWFFPALIGSTVLGTSLCSGFIIGSCGPTCCLPFIDLLYYLDFFYFWCWNFHYQ